LYLETQAVSADQVQPGEALGVAGDDLIAASLFGMRRDWFELSPADRLRAGVASPTFALGGHFRLSRQKIPFAFNAGTTKIGENTLGEDLASFLRDASLACCC